MKITLFNNSPTPVFRTLLTQMIIFHSTAYIFSLLIVFFVTVVCCCRL